jgi:ABC-2 type transport system permease protein
MFLWPYLMVGMLLAIGLIFGSLEEYASRMKVSSPGLFLLSASTVAMSSLGIIDAVAGFALYNRWLGTLNYIVLSPMRTTLIFLAAGLPESLLTMMITVTSIAPAAIYLEGLMGGIKLLLVLAVMLAGMLPLLGLSVLAASLLLIVKEETNIINSIVPFTLLVSGVFYPVEILPSLLQAASRVVPVTYVVEAARMVSGFRGPEGASLIAVLYSLALLALAYNSVAAAALRGAEHRLRLRGME